MKKVILKESQLYEMINEAVMMAMGNPIVRKTVQFLYDKFNVDSDDMPKLLKAANMAYQKGSEIYKSKGYSEEQVPFERYIFQWIGQACCKKLAELGYNEILKYKKRPSIQISRNNIKRN